MINTPPAIPKTNIPIKPPTKLEMKPIITAVCAYGKNTAQSTAGTAFGITLSAIPWKAGNKSAKIIRTPE